MPLLKILVFGLVVSFLAIPVVTPSPSLVALFLSRAFLSLSWYVVVLLLISSHASQVRDPVPMFLERVSAVAPPSITTWDKEASVLVTTPPLLPIDEVSCKLLCPSGRTLEGQRRKGVEEGQNLYLLQGWEAGPHTLSVTLSGVAIPGFPLSLEVEDMALKHAALCGVAEDGLVSGLNTCGYAASFILTFQCPEEHLNVSCKDPLNQNVLIDGSDGGQEGVWKVDYLPLLPGPHLVSISVDTAPIPGSPFKVDVLESIGGRGRLLVSLFRVFVGKFLIFFLRCSFPLLRVVKRPRGI